MKIILATRNPSKALQIQAVFSGSPISVLTLDDVGIEGDAIEDGSTIQENALKKALFVHQRAPGIWVMADDTGIFINALNGQPGVKSARWAGDVPTEEITKYTLQKMAGANDRSATFRTAVAVVSPEGAQYFFEGSVDGVVLEHPRTKPQPKMPYSPIFKANESNLVWAEMTVEEENIISHRGKAFRAAREFLERL